jgi:competence protein ComEC
MKKILHLLSFPLLCASGLVFMIVLYCKTDLSLLFIIFSGIVISVIILISGLLFKKKDLIIGSVIFVLISAYLFIWISETNKNYFEVISDFNKIEKTAGYISEFPQIKNNRLEFKFMVKGVKYAENADFKIIKQFEVLVKLKNPQSELKRGDALKITKEMIIPEKNINGFNYREYLFFQGVYAVVLCENADINLINDEIDRPVYIGLFSGTIWNFRESLLLKLKQGLSEEAYAFILSVFFGIRSEIDEDTYKAFQNTGMLHLLAISGMNISFIGGIILNLCRLFLSKSKAFILSILFIFLYILLIFYSASGFRAFLMYFIQGIFFITGLKSLGFTIINCSAVIMILINPFCIFDMGFQLSFLATYGILLFSKIIEDILPDKIPNKFRSLFAVTLSAFTSVFALQWALFGKIQFFSLISSIFVVPVFEGIFIFLFAAAAAYYAMNFWVLAKLIEFPIKIFLDIIILLNNIPPFPLPKIPLFISYLIIPFLVFLIYALIPYLYKLVKLKKYKHNY